MQKWFLDLSVRGKLILIISINISFMVIAGVSTVFLRMNTTADLNQQIYKSAEVESLLHKAVAMHHELRGDLYKIFQLDSGDLSASKVMVDQLKLHKVAMTSFIDKAIQMEEDKERKNQLEQLKITSLDQIVNVETFSRDLSLATIDWRSDQGTYTLKKYDKGFVEQNSALVKIIDSIRSKRIEFQTLVQNSIIDLALVLSLAMLFAISLSVYISFNLLKYIANPIITTERILVKLHAGEITDTVEVQGNDETARMLRSLNGVVTNLNNVKEFVTEVGNGNFDTNISVFDNKGEIYESLNKMKNDLKQTAEEDQKRNWTTEGMAKFGEILRLNNDNIAGLANSIIGSLVKYLDANQGGLFLVNDTNPNHKYLELIACYAWNKKKYLNMRLELGEGLVGQAWQENDVVYITDVPDDFIRITSGLGHANPSCFLIVPLAVNDVTYGVIEIASFNVFEKYQIDFVKKIAESIASTLSTAKINERTKILLEQSQQQAEEMRAQEEEMRQNMEEMHATQEEMQRKEQEMNVLLEKLKKESK